MNTGKYKTGTMNDSRRESPSFFNTKLNDLEAIEDILSDINSLNESWVNLKYTSAKIFPKGAIASLGESMNKYKGNKNFSAFASSGKRFNNSSNGMFNSATNKLDDLLSSYQLGENLSNSTINSSNINKNLSLSTDQ